MRLDVKDLPPDMQKQVLRKLAEEDKRKGNAWNCSAKRSEAKAGHCIEKLGEGEESHCVAKERQSRVSNRDATAMLSLDEQSGVKNKSGSKYHSRKVTLELNDGTEHTFDSKHEAKVYSELALMERAGEITDLQLQVPYELIPKMKAPSGKTYRACRYIADFVYKDNEGNTVVADAKGMKTEVYKIKKKLMLEKWGIEITEV